jgi:hypothetical protein
MKNLLNRIYNWIKNLFNKISPELKNAVHIGAGVTEAIKDFDTKNPEVADIITTLIPGELDDAIKNKIREELPKIVVELKLVDSTMNLTDPNEIMLAAVKVIQQLEGDYSSAFLHNLSILIAQVAADGKLSWEDAVYLMEWYYQNYVKKAA